jgi:hypothetical protein
MRTALFLAVRQRVVVIPYRRFGTTYPIFKHESTKTFESLDVKQSSLPIEVLEDGIDRLSRNVGKELPLLAAS